MGSTLCVMIQSYKERKGSCWRETRHGHERGERREGRGQRTEERRQKRDPISGDLHVSRRRFKVTRVGGSFHFSKQLSQWKAARWSLITNSIVPRLTSHPETGGSSSALAVAILGEVRKPLAPRPRDPRRLTEIFSPPLRLRLGPRSSNHTTTIIILSTQTHQKPPGPWSTSDRTS